LLSRDNKKSTIIIYAFLLSTQLKPLLLKV
jgi:hypothetical protein